MDFSIKEIEALQKMIDPDGETESAYDNFSSGSMLNPGAIGGQQRTDMAPPNAKINAIVNRKPNAEIWKEEDLNVRKTQLGDDRPEPEYELLYQQKVGTEDVYLGMSEWTLRLIIAKIYWSN